MGFHSDAMVRTLVNRPGQPSVIWAGTDRGILRSRDAGRTWQRLDGPPSQHQVWRIAFHPADAKVVFVGTGTPSTAKIFRSEDDGATWKQLPVEIAAECPAVGVPRVTDIAIDPLEPMRLWASIEVDGMRRSIDGGESWQRIDGGITNPDGHAATVTSGIPRAEARPPRGGHRAPARFQEHFQPGAAARLPCVGQNGSRRIARASHRQYQRAGGEAEPRKHRCPYTPSAAEVPERVLAASRYGYLYESLDGGSSFRKLKREFSEVSSTVWVPDE